MNPEDILKALDGEDEQPQPQKKSNKRDERVKLIYAEAHKMNRAGLDYSKQNLDDLAQMHKLNLQDVEDIFISIFDDNKDEFGIDKKSDIYKVELYLKKKYDFIRNEVSQVIEFRLKNTADYSRVNTDSLYRELQHIGLGSKFGLDKVKSLLRSDFVTNYNPFKNYFDLLPEWDGVDHISQLAGYVKTNDQDFFTKQFEKAMVRSIACGIANKENRIVFVFVGEKQEAGKSTFIRFLNPFGNKYYTESPIRDNKDSEFRFSENFIYNLEELSSLNNIEINKLKAIISKSVIKERKPYATDEEEHPRRCNFWGSTNKTEFLTDTENTRWLCFNVEYIDWKYKTEIDIHKVWAQAWHLYNNGYEFNLTKTERDKRDAYNKGYELNSNERDLILLYFDNPEENKKEFMTNSQIMEYIIEKTSGRFKLNNSQMGRALTQLGFVGYAKKINGKIFRGYDVYKNTVTDSDLNGILQSEKGIHDDTPF